MIDLKDFRQNPDRYRQAAAAKGIEADVDRLVEVDQQWRSLQHQREELTAEKNRIGKEIGQLAGQIKKAEGEEKDRLQQQMDELKQRPDQIKREEEQLAEQVKQLEPERRALWMEVPQPPDDDVPEGESADDNVPLRTWAPDWFDPSRPFVENKGFEPKTHMELGRDLGIVDLQRGVKVAGSGSYVLSGDGMALEQALLNYAFDFMVHENGFTPTSVPVLVREQMMEGTGFFPHGRDQAYQIANPTGEEQMFLTGTGEVGLMGLHADEILDKERLPLCYTTVSTCFRREAGSHGKESAGLYRIHQFEKVEQVVICEADEAESRRWHEQMIGYVETLLRRLELPYQLLQCCTADLGPKNADMIDLECWMPSRGDEDEHGRPKGAYGETHSASRLYDYQCRRLNVRYREGKKNVIAHSLNNTVAASPRMLIPILELYQNEDGTVTVPEVLRPYMNGRSRIGTSE